MKIRRLYLAPLDESGATPAAAPAETDNSADFVENIFEELSRVDDADYSDDADEQVPAATDVPAEKVPSTEEPAQIDNQAAETSAAEPAPQQPIDVTQLTPEQLAYLREQMGNTAPAAEPTEEQQNAEALEKYNSDINGLTDFYTLNDEERAQMESDPATAISVLAAKMHYQVVNAVTQGVMGSLPNAIQHTMQQHQRNEKLQNQFMEAWPQLNESHIPDVFRIGQLYRQTNPTASVEQFIKDVGAQVVVQHGLHNVQANAASTNGQVPQPAQPQRQVLPPDVPAGAGTGTQAATEQVSSGDMWDNLSREFEED